MYELRSTQEKTNDFQEPQENSELVRNYNQNSKGHYPKAKVAIFVLFCFVKTKTNKFYVISLRFEFADLECFLSNVVIVKNNMDITKY